MKRIFCDFCGREVLTERRVSEYVTPKLPIWMKLVISAVIENDMRFRGSHAPKPFDACENCAKEANLWLDSFKSAWDIAISGKTEGQTCDFDDLLAEVIRLACQSYSFGRVEEITLTYDETIDLRAFLKSLPFLETKTLEDLRDKWEKLFENRLMLLHNATKKWSDEEIKHYHEDPSNFDDS